MYLPDAALALAFTICSSPLQGRSFPSRTPISASGCNIDSAPVDFRFYHRFSSVLYLFRQAVTSGMTIDTFLHPASATCIRLPAHAPQSENPPIFAAELGLSVSCVALRDSDTLPRRLPDVFTQFPFHADSGRLAKLVQKAIRSTQLLTFQNRLSARSAFRVSCFDFRHCYCFGLAASCFSRSSVHGGTIPICRAYAIDCPRCSP